MNTKVTESLGVTLMALALSAAASGAAYAQARCNPGFVWREAGQGDFVCVPPEDRDRARAQNAKAASRLEPNPSLRHSGPATCRSGFVWREAFNGDTVCVTPDDRQRSRTQNQLGPGRTVGSTNID